MLMSSGEPFAGAPPNGFCYFKKMEQLKEEFLYIRTRIIYRYLYLRTFISIVAIFNQMLLSLFLTKKLNYIISYSISIYYKTTLYNS